MANIMKQNGLVNKISRLLSGFLALGIFIYVVQAVFNFFKIFNEPVEDKSALSTIELERWINDGGQN